VSSADRPPGGIDEILRVEGGRVLATLRRLTGDLDAAEDALSDAVVEALEQWPRRGIPERPAAWLTTVARRRAVDRLRRDARRPEKEVLAVLDEPDPLPYSTVRDDQLRLVFTCCHPALSPEAQVALALRTLCGLTTTEIARAFLVAEPTMGQRISRAKAKLRANNIAYRVPTDAELPARLASVLAVVNVVFTTGHHAPAGAALTRVDLMDEGVRLARLLVELMPDEPECVGLLALCLSTSARRSTRVGPDDEVVLLTDADRAAWDHDATAEASALLERALRRGRPGPFQVRAAISCLHSLAPDHGHTDWAQIVELYRILETMEPSVPVRVNRAVAEAELYGPEVGLDLLADLGGGEGWHLLHATRADLLRRAGRTAEAATAYEAALALDPSDADARFLRARRDELP
jgi:RNA polymerase sigma-70 factor (ECF subfamily)